MKKHLFLLAVLSAFFLGGASFGAVFPVSTWTELRDAVDAASQNGQGDVIEVAPGTYHFPSSIMYWPADRPEDFPLTIRGAGIAFTVFDGGGESSMLSISPDTRAEDGNAHITVRGITFQNGLKTNSGGAGLSITTKNAPITVEDCAFLHCAARGSGGGLMAQTLGSGRVLVRNCLFQKNGSDQEDGAGAALRSRGGGNLIGVNNTFVGNAARVAALWMYFHEAGGKADVYNNIFWNNTSPEPIWPRDLKIDWDSGEASHTVNLYHNIIDDKSIKSETDLSGDINGALDPLLNVNGRLKEGSPCIDAGKNDAPMLPAADFDSEPRIFGAAVDMGADERVTFAVPAGAHQWTYGPAVFPAIGKTAGGSKPFAAGRVASGGSAVDLRVAFPFFSEPVDIYLVLYFPALTPQLFLVGPGNALAPLSAGLVPWKSGIVLRSGEMLFAGLPVSAFPSGTYYLGAMVVPGGAPGFGSFYLWITSFVI